MNSKKGTVKRICEYLFSGAIIAVVLILLLWFLYYFKIFNMPSFINDFFGGKQESVDKSYYDEENFYSYLSSKNEPVVKTEKLELNSDNVKSFIDALVMCDDYYWEIELSFFYAENSETFVHKSWSHDGKVRIDSLGRTVDTSTVYDGENTYVRDNISGKKETLTGETAFGVDDLVNIADIRFYLNSSLSRIETAELINTESGKYLHASFYTESLDKTDDFYVSLDNGAVLFVDSKISDIVVFQQKTVDFYDLASLSDSYFKI